MKRIAFAITLLLALMGAAVAQSNTALEPAELWPGYPLSTEKMVGLEASPGVMDMEDAMCWGRTFTMLNASFNFTIAPNYYFKSLSWEEQYDRIAGGTWTMLVYKGKKQGMLFGEIVSGTIEWKTDRAGNVLYGEVLADITIKGGTGDFENAGGKHTFGKFVGYADYTAGGNPVVVGSVDLWF